MASQVTPSRREEWSALQGGLSEILSSRGRNGPESDYQLVAEDFGTFEQKVLVFYRDVITPELVETIQDLLSRYSRKWRVQMLAANRDGSQVIPPTGLEVSAVGMWALPREKISAEEDRETKELYLCLEELLSGQGKGNAFGQGDYWIVDDSWVPRSHKVCIFNIEFFTPQLARNVQQLLKEKFPACQVWFQIEVVEPGIPIPLPGVRIFADRIEQDWNRLEMKSMFKDRFSW